MLPASNLLGSKSMIVTPVCMSPFIMACWMGEAPRYLGSNEGCAFSMHIRAIPITFAGIKYPNEATSPMSNSSGGSHPARLSGGAIKVSMPTSLQYWRNAPFAHYYSIKCCLLVPFGGVGGQTA